MNTLPDLDQLRLITQVLSLHFEEGMLQSEVACRLGLSSAKVNRLIKQGRELGMVQITIKSPLMRLFDLERALMERWRLGHCVVVPSVQGSGETTLKEVGRAAAELLLTKLRDGDTIAISGGRTLSTVIENLNAAVDYDVNVVPMTGGVQGQHYTDVNHLATELAKRLSGRATLLHAPLHADTRKNRDLLMSMKSVRGVLDEARGAAVALVGIGAVVDARSTYYEAHPEMAAEREALYDAGVRGELLGHLIDERGALSGDGYNSRLVALEPREISQMSVSIAVASGPAKPEPIVAAMRGGYFNAFVTDENTALSVLGKESKQ